VLAGVGLAGSLWTGNNIVLGMIVFSIAAIGVNARLPAFWALPHSFLGGAAAAASIGTINCIGGLGGFVGPYIVGALSTPDGGYSAGVWCLTAASFIAAVLILVIPRSPSKNNETHFKEPAQLSR
jgi:nitrate/nitrite transporter NarK